MKVALVHDHLDQLGGAELVLKTFHEIFPDAPIHTLVHDPKKTKGAFANMDIRTSVIQKLPFGKSRFKWYLLLMPAAFEQFNLTGYDVVLSSSSALAKGVITRPETLHVCYCYTPTRYLWSDFHQYREELHQNSIVKKILPIFLHRLRMWDRLSADRVDKFLTSSDFVADRIRKYYRRNATVINPPTELEKFKIAPETGDYFLMVTRLRPYKRADLAIKVFNQLGYPLHIIGSGEEEKNLREIAEPNIKFLGFVDEATRKREYSKCLAFINPQEEDFGITPLEAMASGRPVIAYNRGGACETVINEKTGVFFDEQTEKSLADAVKRFKTEDFNPEQIREHALNFNKERFKREIREYIDKAWDKHRHRLDKNN